MESSVPAVGEVRLGEKPLPLSVGLSLARVGLGRPSLVPHMVGAAWAFRARGWYRRPPFLPLPPADYWRWRMDTAYGNPEAVPPPEELERFLRWGTDMRRRTRVRRSSWAR